MPRFPSLHPPQPTVGRGYVKPGANATPVPQIGDPWKTLRTPTVDPLQTGGVGGGSINFTMNGPTLEALRERQQRLQQAAPELPPPAQMTSPWQGAAFLANSFVNSLQQNRAAAEEERGQQEFAEAMATGIDPVTGQLKPEAMATVMARNPEVGLQFIGDMIKSRRDRVQTVTGDRAKAMGLDPTRTWQVDNGKATDITPTEGTTYRPMTAEEYKTFNIPVDPTTGLPTKPYRWNVKEGKPEAIGGEPASAQPMTDWQNRDLGYYYGGSQANDSLSEGNNDAVLATMDTSFWSSLGDWSGSAAVKALANKQLSPQQQIALNDALNFAAAVNRKESGASLTEQEIAGTLARYLPAYGDSPETIEKKRQARAEKLDSFTFGLSGRPELQAAKDRIEADREQRKKDREAEGRPDEPDTAAPAAPEAPAPPDIDRTDPKYIRAKKNYLAGGGTELGWKELEINGKWTVFQ